MKCILVILLTVTMATTLLAGCSSSQEPPDGPVPNASEEPAEPPDQQGEAQKETGEPGEESPDNSAQTNTYYLSQLKNGDAVGSFTIKNISFSENIVEFELQGDMALEGEIYYDDYTSSLWFEVADKSDFPVIIIDSIDEELEYTPGTLFFRNYDSFYNSLPAGSIKEVKENFGRVSASIKVKDLNAWVKADYYETGCEFLGIVN